MSAMPLEAPPPPVREWTVADLEALPEDGYRREIIDGVLYMTPTPTFRHNKIIGLLWQRLLATCPQDYAAIFDVEVRLSQRRSLVPDVLVMTAEAAERNPHRIAPHEAVLAVEVVSPSTVAVDGILKPALYAQAGVPFYWRIDSAPSLTVHTYRLDPGAEMYTPTGVHSGTLHTDEPWEIRLDLGDITP